MNEREIIEHLRRRFPRAGDDAAVIDDRVITNDMLVEDVDFTRAIPLEFIARKSLAVNLSDLAAMGAHPEWAMVALGIPQWVDARAFIDRIADAASAHHIEIIGGDLSRAEKFVVSITAAGRVSRPLLRSGARRGDRLYVSRPLGASFAGLHLLQNGWSIAANGDVSAPPDVAYAQREFGAAAIRRHVDPEPEVCAALHIIASRIRIELAPRQAGVRNRTDHRARRPARRQTARATRLGSLHVGAATTGLARGSRPLRRRTRRCRGSCERCVPGSSCARGNAIDRSGNPAALVLPVAG